MILVADKKSKSEPCLIRKGTVIANTAVILFILSRETLRRKDPESSRRTVQRTSRYVFEISTQAVKEPWITAWPVFLLRES